MRSTLTLFALLIVLTLQSALPAAAQTTGGSAMAPRPERIDPAAANRDRMSGHDGGAHAKMALDAQMENLKKARTVRGLNHVAGGIFAILHEMESREAESRRAEFYRAYNEAARQVAPSLNAGLKVSGQGQWYQIGNLGGNTTWNLGNYLVDVVEVQITNSDTSLSCGPDWITSEPGPCPVDLATFHIDNLSISPQ